MKIKQLTELSQEELLWKLLSEKLNATDPTLLWNTTLNQKTNKYVSTLGKKKLSEGQVASFKSEAQLLDKMGLWKAVKETLKYDAQYRMFIASDSLEKIFAGKMLLYALDVIEKIITSAANPDLSPSQTTKTTYKNNI